MLNNRCLLVLGVIGILLGSCAESTSEQEAEAEGGVEDSGAISHIDIKGRWMVSDVQVVDETGELKQAIEADGMNYDVFVEMTKDSYAHMLYEFGEDQKLKIMYIKEEIGDFEGTDIDYAIDRKAGEITIDGSIYGLEVQGCDFIKIIKHHSQDSKSTTEIYLERVEV